MDARAEAAGILGRVVDVRPGEVRALLVGFAYFFALLFGYYLLRPLREEMGIRADVTKLHWLFWATAAVMLVAVPIYSAVLGRVPRRRAIPWVYRFFLLHLLAFWALVRADAAPVWVARAFYVWLSVYNLFVVSVFWSLLADVFTSAQARRLFGFIAAGGSAGALLGSALVAALADRLGVGNLLLLAAAFLEASARCASAVARGPGGREPGERPRDDAALGGSAWAGFAAVARSPYLLAMAAQMLLFSLGSTFLYFNLARTVAGTLADSAARTALFAKVDLAVSVGALATQSLATGRIVAALGLRGALALVPALSAVGFAVAAAVPGVWTLSAFQVIRRATHFAVDRPSREVLFTVVPRDDKYKAKAFIDTFVYRGSDAASAALHAKLAAVGLALPALSASAIPFALLSMGLALWLARRERRLEETCA